MLPGFVIASALQRELLVVRIGRRVAGRVRFEHVVAVVDEIGDTGETLDCVRRSTVEHGAARVVTAALAAHSWAAPQPDVVSLVTDELVVFPWNARILVAGRWQPDPEVEAALEAQERAARESHPGSGSGPPGPRED